LATTTETPWQAQIIEELDALQLDDELPAEHTHAAVFVPNVDDASAMLLGTAESEIAAVVIAEDKGAQFAGDGEARVVKLADLAKWSAANAAGHPEPELEGPTVEPRRQNVETDEPAEIPFEGPEHDEDDDAPPAAPEPAPGEQAAAFDRSQYEREDLQIAKIDGQSIDRISLKFSGEVFLDRSEASDVAVYNAFRLGKNVALLIEAKCSSTAAKGATDRDGDLDVVVGTKGLKIHTISKPAGADWVTEA
jgi:hypothetical protein